MPTIEVELRFAGSTIKAHEYIGKGWVQKEEDRLSEALFGLLCTDHAQLPKVESKLSDGRWVVEIQTCCEFSLNLIEKRLDEIYKK